MENKLGRKSMAEWLETMQGVMGNLYNDAFQAGYDAAKDEVLDIDTMAQHLVDRYNDEGLSNLMMIVDKIRPRRVIKSANQQRAELIQRAREFVERKTESLKDSPEIDGGWDFKERENPRYCEFITNVEFLINDKKRTVVALLRMVNGIKIESKGIAKCMPDEVFNADIGKAIALARALSIPIPRVFLEAVQPSHYSVGQVVKRKDELFKTSCKYRVDRIGKGSTLTILRDNDYGGSAICDTTTSLDYEDENIKALQVIDDSNAQYEVTP